MVNKCFVSSGEWFYCKVFDVMVSFNFYGL